MHILYINDLFNININLINYFNEQNIKKFSYINWLDFDYSNENFVLDYCGDILLHEINNIDDEITIIIDTFSIFIFDDIYKYIKKDKIKKIIVINTFTNTLFLKLLNIKNLLIPNNAKQMIYKEMYYYYNFKNFRENEELIDISYKCLDFINQNNFLINRLLNEMLTTKKIKSAINYLKNNQTIKIILGEHNPLLSKKDIESFKNNSITHFLIKDSGINIFNENFNDAIKILMKLIYE